MQECYPRVFIKRVCGFLALYSFCLYSSAAAFDRCPTQAFLIQDNVARIYGVNLATGFYDELANDMGSNNKINAMGFNVHDNYLYAFSYEFKALIRIDSNFSVSPISVSALPTTTFFVGDVALEHNSYYVYRSGSNYGLYRIDLDENSEQYLAAQRVIDGSSLRLAIYDFAFHPNNGYLYSVDRTGNLWQIDAQTGQATNIANVGESGTFGAVYFDGSGRFYISRNSDGYIFRIDVSADNPEAEFFAFGPASGNNDGARCALAPIVSADSSVDFGDAPDSYGTSIEANGARHELSEDLFLGDRAGGADDGVEFVTGFEAGLDTLVNVRATGGGYLNAWVDWDQNGSFDSDEHAIVNQAMQDGDNRILIDVPDDASVGNTWGRIRYSSTQDIGATGGVSDGEVEDHPVTVTSSGVSIVSYPGNSRFVTLAYEDNWPRLGDYDMNDVVIAYRTRQYINENSKVVRYDIEGRLLALGADYHNGFAVQLDNIAADNIAEQLIRFEINGEMQTSSPLEDNGAEDAVIRVTDDLWSHIRRTDSCRFYRAQLGCEQSQHFSFLVSVPLIDAAGLNDAPSDMLNPFIFATPNRYHGDGFDSPPGRSLEIHLKNKKVSARFDRSLFQRFDDQSDSDNHITFISSNNMPWGLELPILWAHPHEGTDLINAYPDFVEFIQSEGVDNPLWYTLPRAVSDRVITNEE